MSVALRLSDIHKGLGLAAETVAVEGVLSLTPAPLRLEKGVITPVVSSLPGSPKKARARVVP